MASFDHAIRADTGALIALFGAVFTASEGPGEGEMIGALVEGLLTRTPPDDIAVFCARDGDALVGAVVFSRLDPAHDPRHLVLLSPMAVATAHQGQGIGQALIRHALADLAARGVAVVATYGDPAFYGRVGFAPVSPAILPPPHALSQPEGWIAQALDGGTIAPFAGPLQPVGAFDDPALW